MDFELDPYKIFARFICHKNDFISNNKILRLLILDCYIAVVTAVIPLVIRLFLFFNVLTSYVFYVCFM